METTLSSKGQVVLPAAVRRRLGLNTGAALDVEVDKDRVVLTPMHSGTSPIKRETDPATGFPVLDFEEPTAPITSEQVKELMADFP